MAAPLFNESDVLFRDEDFVVVKSTSGSYGIRAYCRVVGSLHETDLHENKAIIARLLSERVALTAETERLWAAAEKMQHEWFVQEQKYRDAREVCAAERDCYRAAVEGFLAHRVPALREGCETWGLLEQAISAFSEALAQGTKIREGT